MAAHCKWFVQIASLFPLSPHTLPPLLYLSRLREPTPRRLVYPRHGTPRPRRALPLWTNGHVRLTAVSWSAVCHRCTNSTFVESTASNLHQTTHPSLNGCIPSIPAPRKRYWWSWGRVERGISHSSCCCRSHVFFQHFLAATGHNFPLFVQSSRSQKANWKLCHSRAHHEDRPSGQCQNRQRGQGMHAGVCERVHLLHHERR